MSFKLINGASYLYAWHVTEYLLSFCFETCLRSEEHKSSGGFLAPDQRSSPVDL